MLLEQGVTPERLFRETIFAGGHDQVTQAVLEGRVDAGAIYDGALGVAQQKGIPVETLLTWPGRSPFSTTPSRYASAWTRRWCGRSRRPW